MKLLLFIVTIVLSPLFYIWNGFVASKLWEWFVTPNFANAPKLGIVACIGLTILIKYLTYGSADVAIAKADAMEDKDDEEKTLDLIYSIVIGILIPAFALLSGYVVTLFQ